MKLPIWAKDSTGKYKLFPYWLIEEFPDGTRGISGLLLQDWWTASLVEPFLNHFIAYYRVGPAYTEFSTTCPLDFDCLVSRYVLKSSIITRKTK